jgi:hypothetical protein
MLKLETRDMEIGFFLIIVDGKRFAVSIDSIVYTAKLFINRP